MTNKLFILYIIFLLSGLSLLAQKKQLPDIYLDINMQQTNVRSVLDTISACTGYYFSYSNTLLNDTTSVNIETDSTALENILQMLIPHKQWSAQIQNQHIILKGTGNYRYRKIYGKVTDAKDPLIAASVYLKNALKGVITNEDGEFIIKIEPKNAHDTLIISHIGYKRQAIALNAIKNDTVSVKLNKHSIILEEIIVTAANARTLVKKMLQKIPAGYPAQNTNYTSFYREEVRKGNRYQYFSEAVLKVFKNSYKSIINTERIQRLQSRTLKKSGTKDTILLKIKSGLQTALYLDIVRYQPSFIHPHRIDEYRYQLKHTTYLNDEMIYVINFEPKPGTQARYQGKLLINALHYTLEGADFSYADSRKQALNELLSSRSNRVKIKPRQAEYSIRYKRINNTWYLHYIRSSLSAKMKKKGDWFYRNYTTNSSFYVVKIDTVEVRKPGRRRSINPQIIFSDREFSYTPNFWGKYDYYKPSDRIIEDLKKMEKVNRLEQYIAK